MAFWAASQIKAAVVVTAFLGLCTSAEAGSPEPKSAANTPTMAIEQVTVLPMAVDGAVVRNATVIIDDGRIAAVGPSEEVPVPADARRVNGEGKWLMPALADMHVHLANDRMVRLFAGRPDLPAGMVDPADLLTPYVANGVLQVMDMAAMSEAVGMRADVEAGRLRGPHIALAAMVDGSPPSWPIGMSRVAATPADGRQVVRDIKAEGYDFVKAYSNLGLETFSAIVDEAGEQDLKVLGHIPGMGKIPIEAIFQPGYDMVAHAEEFAFQSEDLSDADIARFVELAQRNGAWLTSTLFLDEQILAQTRDPNMLRRVDGLAYVHTCELPMWFAHNRYTSRNSPERIAELQRLVAFNRRLVRAFADAGIPIVAGTDTGIPGVVAGFALHEELKALARAGLNNEQILASATRLPAQWLGVAEDRGTVAPGKRADLLLLEADPLADIANTRKIAAVMIGGRYLPGAELDAMLERLAKRYAGMGAVC